MKLNEQINSISRLLNNTKIFPENKKNLQEATGNPVHNPFDMAQLVGRLIYRKIPKDVSDEIDNIIDKLSLPTVRAIEFDETGRIIKGINLDNISDSQLKNLFRIPEVREALEDYAKNYRARDNGPIYPIDLNNINIAGANPRSPFSRIINAYRNSKNDIITLTKFDKIVRLPFKRLMIKYGNFDNIYEFFKDKIKYNLMLRGVETGIKPDYALRMKKLYEDAVKITKDWSDVQGKGMVNIDSYRKKLYDILKEMKLLDRKCQRDVFDKLVTLLPENIKKELDDTVKITDDELSKLWEQLTAVSKSGASFDDKYLFYLGGVGRMLSDIRGGRGMDFAKRWGNFLIGLDFRLNREMTNNIRVKGRFGFIWREASLRAFLYAIAVGTVDYYLAYQKKEKGTALNILGTNFEPNLEWQRPKEIEDKDVNGLGYFLSHVGQTSGTYFLKHPIHASTMGPLPRVIDAFFNDPNKQRNKDITETELYDKSWEEYLKNVRNNEEYKLLSPQDKIKAEEEAKVAFETQFKKVNEAKKALKKLDN
jgi:hypothetical protein